jgi:type IV pilus assembly protein PilX
MNAQKHSRQQGAVLITSLIFLVVITMLVLSAMSTNTVEEKMVNNSLDRNAAFQAAEAALRDGGRDVQSTRVDGSTNFKADCTNGLCLPQADGTPIDIDLKIDTNWLKGTNGGNTIAYGTYSSSTWYDTAAAGLTAAQRRPSPRYIIEALQTAGVPGTSMVLGFKPVPPNYVYRVTARGYGRNVDSNGDPTSVVTLQAVYNKQK